MANRYYHVGSITNAMRAKRLLEAKGAKAYIHRTTNPPDGDGCGYSVLVVGGENAVEKILRSGGVRVIRVSEAL